MASEESKGRWKKGESGNPKGRPKKGECLTDILRSQAAKKDVKDGNTNITRKEALAKRLWALALSGDIAAIKYIYDRIDGRPDQKQQVDMGVSGAEAAIAILNEAYEKHRKPKE